MRLCWLMNRKRATTIGDWVVEYMKEHVSRFVQRPRCIPSGFLSCQNSSRSSLVLQSALFHSAFIEELQTTLLIGTHFTALASSITSSIASRWKGYVPLTIIFG